MKLHRSALLKTGWFFGAVVLSFTVLAQTDKLQLELGKCAVITDINARVACYDNLARPKQEAAVTSQAPAAKVAEPAPTGKVAEPAAIAKPAAPVRLEPEAAKIEKFGQQQAKIESNTKGEDVLVGKVAALKELGPNKLQITLANGQVWQQTISKAFFINVNDSVRISPSSWGNSYRLEKDGKPGFIQVTRLH